MSDKLVRIKNRYDTAVNWETENPVLAAGEIGIDSTNNIIKVGNGSTNWNDLVPISMSNDIVMKCVPKIINCFNYGDQINALEQFEAGFGAMLVPSAIGHQYQDNFDFSKYSYLFTIYVDGYYPQRIVTNKNGNHQVKLISYTDAQSNYNDSLYVTFKISIGSVVNIVADDCHDLANIIYDYVPNDEHILEYTLNRNAFVMIEIINDGL